MVLSTYVTLTLESQSSVAFATPTSPTLVDCEQVSVTSSGGVRTGGVSSRHMFTWTGWQKSLSTALADVDALVRMNTVAMPKQRPKLGSSASRLTAASPNWLMPYVFAPK